MTRDHPTFEQLVDLASGQLPLEEQAPTRAHTATCEACAADLAWLERTLASLSLPTIGPPPAAAAHVKALLRTRRAPTRQRVGATLRFDSARAPQAGGLRADADDERQLLFAAGQFDIDVHLTPAEDQWVVAGQIFGPATSGAIELAGSSGAFRTALSDLCEFALPPVPVGRYTLFVQIDDLEVTIPDLELGT
jgi:anti-sigma factor RsiW